MIHRRIEKNSDAIEMMPHNVLIATFMICQSVNIERWLFRREVLKEEDIADQDIHARWDITAPFYALGLFIFTEIVRRRTEVTSPYSYNVSYDITFQSSCFTLGGIRDIGEDGGCVV